MARPKGSKNKVTKVKAARMAAKADRKVAKKSPNKAQESPDWLRKAMAVSPKPKGRPPGTKNRPKIEPQTLKRGKKPMAIKPHYDPLDDPDLRADTKGDLPPPELKPPGGYLPDPADPNYGINTPTRPDQSLPGAPVRPGQPLPLPGGGVAPDNTLPETEAPKFDEVQSGAVIPDENLQALIAGTMGGSGDHHAMAKRIVERMKEAKWVTTKAADEGTGDTAKAKTAKKGKDEDERKDDKR